MRLPKKWMLVAVGLVALVLLAWMPGRLRGPVLPGYEVAAGPLVQSVVGTGRVLSPSRVQVRAEMGGLVLERRVMDGDRVEAGDVLVVLRAEDLEARRDEARAALAALREAELPDARARLRQARADLAQAERSHARRRELAGQQLVARESVEQAAQAEVAARAAAEQARLAVQALAGGAREGQLRERLEAAEAELARAVVRAAGPGIVLSRHVEPGATVVPGDLLLEIAADAPGEILVPLDEKNLARLEPGQQAICIADAFPDRPFAATVHHIAPGVDPARGTVDVRLLLDAAVDFLRQDMTVTATIQTGQRTRALVVPNDALLDAAPGSHRAHALVLRGGRLQRVPVQLGLRGLVMSEVLEGLEEGEQVVAAGALEPRALPEDGSRARVRGEPVPDAGDDRATRGEMPVQLD